MKHIFLLLHRHCRRLCRHVLQNLHEKGFLSYLTVNYYSQLSLVFISCYFTQFPHSSTVSIKRKRNRFCVTVEPFSEPKKCSGFNSSFLAISSKTNSCYSMHMSLITLFENCSLNRLLWFCKMYYSTWMHIMLYWIFQWNET